MFQKLITYSIQHKLVIGVLTIALIAWGAWSLSRLPFDSTPDITDNQVQVITQAPSLGAQEVEQYITTPIEMALATSLDWRRREVFHAVDFLLLPSSSTMMQTSIGLAHK